MNNRNSNLPLPLLLNKLWITIILLIVIPILLLRCCTPTRATWRTISIAICPITTIICICLGLIVCTGLLVVALKKIFRTNPRSKKNARSSTQIRKIWNRNQRKHELHKFMSSVSLFTVMWCKNYTSGVLPQEHLMFWPHSSCPFILQMALHAESFLSKRTNA